jgi:hypothetical protein
MTSQNLLIPLRIPELGPSLGKLVTGTGRTIEGFSLESHRHHLTSKIIEMAGEARRLAASEERSAALAALGRDAWLAAWEDTVGPIADALVDRLTTHLEAEAAAVRKPRRLRAKVAIDEVERRAIGARLGSAGAQLIPELDAIERQGTALLQAAAAGHDSLVAWQQAQLTAARHLEEAWMALEGSVKQELAGWRAVADEIARWRKPLWPVFVVGGSVAAVATWAGLLWGGVIPVPEWLGRVWDMLRSLGA